MSKAALLVLVLLSGSAGAEMGPTLGDRSIRNEMAKQRKESTQEADFFEVRRKRSIANRKQAEKQVADALLVVRQSYLDQTVSVIRNRAIHVNDDIASIRTEIATYTGEDLTVINAILDALEAEEDQILIDYPVDWPDN
jgi:hypothetical protein